MKKKTIFNGSDRRGVMLFRKNSHVGHMVRRGNRRGRPVEAFR